MVNARCRRHRIERVSDVARAIRLDEREMAALVAEAGKTRPLSRIMSERLVRLREWAAERTVAAG